MRDPAKTKADNLRFLNIAQGSLEESRYYLILARDLDYGDVSELGTVGVEGSTLLETYSQAILNSDSEYLSSYSRKSLRFEGAGAYVMNLKVHYSPGRVMYKSKGQHLEVPLDTRVQGGSTGAKEGAG